jgi:UDP-glucuronate 4-epimerase
VVEGVVRCLDKPATADSGFDAAAPDPATSWAPHRLFNLGNSQPVALLSFIGALERALGKEAIKTLLPMQAGDVEATAADTTLLEAWVGFRPSTPLEQGVERFAAWYLDYSPGRLVPT